jgi:DNA (cytosine-5)-methyltransferase 3A
MKQEHQDVISKYLGVEPIAINSSLVSAQNRYRLYWCNWDITQPEDKGLLLRDVLVEGFGDSVRNQGTKVMKKDIDKAHCLLARDYKGFGNQDMTGVRVGRMVGRRINPDTGKRDDYNHDIPIKQRLEPRKDERSGCLTTVDKDNLVVEKGTYRPLLPIEMERLQTLPDNYTEGVSNTQRKKMLGNGWTVDVIVHILKQGGFNGIH